MFTCEIFEHLCNENWHPSPHDNESSKVYVEEQQRPPHQYPQNCLQLLIFSFLSLGFTKSQLCCTVIFPNMILHMLYLISTLPLFLNAMQMARLYLTPMVPNQYNLYDKSVHLLLVKKLVDDLYKGLHIHPKHYLENTSSVLMRTIYSLSF